MISKSPDYLIFEKDAQLMDKIGILYLSNNQLQNHPIRPVNIAPT
jgi:hypothetical protein